MSFEEEIEKAVCEYTDNPAEVAEIVIEKVKPLIEALEHCEAALAILVTEKFGVYKHDYPALVKAREALNNCNRTE